jgi:hypothetical protein
MIRKFSIIFVLFSFLVLAELATATKLKSSWKNPSATASSLQFSKIIVIAPIKQEMIRKVAEDRAVALLEDGKRTVMPSYVIFGITELDDKEQVKSKLAELSFDGAIVIRYAGSEDEKKYEDEDYGVWNDPDYFYGVYCPACGAVYNATERNDTKVFVETMLFSLKENKLIWSGITETKNPKNPAIVVGQIAEEMVKNLQKEGLMPKKK